MTFCLLLVYRIYIYIKLLESWLIGLISDPNEPCSQYLKKMPFFKVKFSRAFPIYSGTWNCNWLFT